ncbi:heme-degrading domain-containing protein [Massilia sp. YIM B02443]|uniref:heme-degrading domain-containing protein n=1 Tax=Massilia sp. YIM B02443 TaxID=3050127 RepID=UPI0025B724C7|nr:heme-degrading domain-containing protein [Massilia sp. YIM B02443]MDN4038854.1 heme-degrading domain-containing protein [Massilia sp. YIM B02443]
MRRLSIPLLFLAAGTAAAQSSTIKLNQVGFLPQAHKLAVVPQGASGTRFEVVGADGKTVFEGALGAPGRWEPSGETVRVADFSALAQPGTYRLKVAGLALSDPFAIKPDAYRALGDAALKAYYFNRSGIGIDARYGGAWARAAGHPDDKVLVHVSAASRARPQGTVIASPKGWYDAGDYNKYVVNSGISTYTLLAAFEHYPGAFKHDVGIPESGNGVPDILDEALWNLEWMLTMQDPNDGGVYHKLTNLRFDGTVMPHEANRTPRYVVAKSTAAALDFAATMAAAGRVLAPYEKQWPGMAARMLAAAEGAWRWAEANPKAVFKNPADVKTGEYGDDQLDDEFFWAAAELFIATGKDAYSQALRKYDAPLTTPSWGNVRALGWISLAQARERLAPSFDRARIEARLDGLAAQLAETSRNAGYRVPMASKDFVWGSNAMILNQAMMLLQAYRLNRKPDYLAAAQSGLDYVLGRNATGYAFVTGIGARPFLHPHHRPSMADGVAAPVPGWLAGGPNPGQQDKKDCPAPYPSTRPALSYIDHDCSYAANEVAINWNAPLVYVTAALSTLTPRPMDKDLVALDLLAREEQQLQFERFDQSIADAIGAKIVERARNKRQTVTVQIKQGETVLFTQAMPGASPDHLDWIRRKNNLVKRTGHSSFYTHNEVRQGGGDHDALPGLDMRDYAAHGGAFPVVVRGQGLVGTVTVSGLPGADDHALAVAGVKDYLGVQP